MTHFPSRYETKFTYRGTNIARLRRAQLRPMARDFGLSADGSKVEILARIVASLDGTGADLELTAPPKRKKR